MVREPVSVAHPSRPSRVHHFLFHLGASELGTPYFGVRMQIVQFSHSKLVSHH